MIAKEHNLRIDFLRGVAILLVIIYHYQQVIFPNWFVIEYKDHIINVSTFKQLVLNFSPSAFGYTGVTLFLLISGFLIHLGYLKNREAFSIATFYSKRFWRIFPPYWFCLIGIVALVLGLQLYSISLKDIIVHFFAIHNLFNSTIYSINPALWSLALEVQFYLSYPLFLYLTNKTGIKTAFIITLILSLCWLIIGLVFKNWGEKQSYTHSAIALWFIWTAGCFYAELYQNNKRLNTKKGLGLAVLLFLLLIAAKYFQYTNYLSPYIGALAWLAFFDWFLNAEAIKLKTILSKLVIKIGLCSYSIYLIHQPLLRLFLNMWKGYFKAPYYYQILALLPIFSIIFGIAYILYLTIELPSIAAGNKLRARNL